MVEWFSVPQLNLTPTNDAVTDSAPVGGPASTVGDPLHHGPRCPRRRGVRERPLKRRASQRGLTLLEVLVAVGILAMVSTLIYGAFDGMQRSRTGIERIDERYHQGRQALVRMSRELQSAFLSLHQPQVYINTVRTTIFLGTDGGTSDRVDFTSFSHQRLMRNVHESDQNELSYFMGRDPDHSDKYDLLRREQKEIDLEPTKGGIVSVLCEDVTVFDLQYLEPLTDTWLDSWDTSQVTTQAQFNRLPFQVRIKLVLKGGEGDRPIKLHHQGVARHAGVARLRHPHQRDRAGGAGGDQAMKRIRKKRRADERGIALVLVLGAITVLTVFLTQLQEETSSELASALSERDALKAEYFARSAVNLSRLLIASEPEISKSIAPIMLLLNPKGAPPQIPVWEFTDLVLGPFNDAAGSQSFLSTIGGDATTAKNIGIAGGGRFELTIVDEDAKINLNLAAQNDFGPCAIASAEQILGLMIPPAVQRPLRRPRRRRPVHRSAGRLRRAHRLGRLRLVRQRDAVHLRSPLAERLGLGARGQLLPDHRPPLPPQERRLRLARRGAPGARGERRLLGHFVDPEPDNPKKRVMTVWGQGAGQHQRGQRRRRSSRCVCGQHFTVEPEMCPQSSNFDPQQMATFIMGVTLGKSMTFGLPLFGTPQDFIDMMGGKGPLGTILAGPPRQAGDLQERQAGRGLARAEEPPLQHLRRRHRPRLQAHHQGAHPRRRRLPPRRLPRARRRHPIVGGGQAAANAMAAAATPPPPGSQAAQMAPSSSSSSSSSSGSTTAVDPVTQALQQTYSNPAGTVIYWRVE